MNSAKGQVWLGFTRMGGRFNVGLDSVKDGIVWTDGASAFADRERAGDAGEPCEMRYLDRIPTSGKALGHRQNLRQRIAIV